ncbi:MAG TPA: hypothetical protein VK453_01480 [Micromonosporaceae bacterium]|nr:hypothetical protein [Micromonosporaceae bacterium]
MNDVRKGYNDDRLLIAMWSAPRSRSTAFERMVMERGDFLVLHEPFSHVADFGTATIDGTTVHSERELIDALSELRGRIFFKDTTDFHYPELLADQAFLRHAAHTFIIREPREVIASHVALNPAVTRDEIGFAWLHEIYEAVVAATGAEPVVIDSDDLLDRPAATVEAYCKRVGIPFLAEALRWDKGVPQQWRRTERWHQGASASSGFERRSEPGDDRNVVDDPVLGEYYRYHLPYYTKLWERRLQV